MPIRISEFEPSDQAAARRLILDGLADRWGVLDESLNPDLNDIAATYAPGVFLCAWASSVLIGTGALKRHPDGVAEIVRMSVARAWRRRGVGRQMATALLAAARAQGFKRVILETTATWADAIAFYLGLGFAITHHRDGDVYFALDLGQSTKDG